MSNGQDLQQPIREKVTSLSDCRSAVVNAIEYTGKQLKTDAFNKESDLSQYLQDNIESFCSDLLEDEYISHEAEKAQEKQITLQPRRKRLDLYIECKNHNYIVELKNPRQLASVRDGIGQLLEYGLWFSDSKKQLLLITTHFCFDTARVIKHYGLPIRYFFMSDDVFMEFEDFANDYQ
jgi:hypothetical protein